MTRPLQLRGLTPLAYRGLVTKAGDAFRAEKWSEAAQLYEQAVAAYPYDGKVAQRLATSRYRAGDFLRAAEAYVLTDRLGLPAYSENNAAMAARSYAKAGRAAEAARWAARAIDLHHLAPHKLLAEEVFGSVRDTPEFRTLIASRAPAQAGSPGERRLADLDYLVREVKRMKLAPKSGAADSAAFSEAAASLRSRIGSLSDVQALVEMQKLIALFGEGHNSARFLYAPEAVNGQEFKQLPLDFYVFPTGVYVVGTDAANRGLLGARLEKIGTLSADETLARIAAMKDRDNDMAVIWHGPSLMSRTTLLHAVGAADHPDRAHLTVRLPSGGVRKVNLNGGPVRQRPKLAAYAAAKSPAPLYLQRVPESFWFTDLDAGTTYFQFNQVRKTTGDPPLGRGAGLAQDTGGETIDAFAKRLKAHLDQRKPRTLIVDLRHNNGGNTYIYTELLRTLIAYDTQPNTRIYTITGRNTFSAATNFAVDVDRLTDALFAGEPMSGSAKQPGDTMEVLLPYSNAAFGLSTMDWALQSPADSRIWIAPEIPAVLTAEDYFSNRDPALEAVLADAQAFNSGD